MIWPYFDQASTQAVPTSPSPSPRYLSPTEYLPLDFRNFSNKVIFSAAGYTFDLIIFRGVQK